LEKKIRSHGLVVMTLP